MRSKSHLSNQRPHHPQSRQKASTGLRCKTGSMTSLVFLSRSPLPYSTSSTPPLSYIIWLTHRRHHLHKSRPLPQPPLCDLLPTAYLASLKRTEARVRFAEAHSGPSSVSSGLAASELPVDPFDEHRPGLRRRSTGPPTEEELVTARGGSDEWDINALASRAEDALGKLAGGGGGVHVSPSEDELRQQLNQLNVQAPTIDGEGKANVQSKLKSNLSIPHPNLPLALLRLMEAYVVGLAQIDETWTEARRERGLTVIKSLNANLSEAERLSNCMLLSLSSSPVLELTPAPPPLPLTLHLSHVLLIYLASLPLSLLPKVSSPILILITLLAGYCLLGLEALVTEVGGVFGESENHHPLPLFAQQILLEALDTSPAFLRSYRSRVVARVGEDDLEVIEIDRRYRRTDEWVPSFD